MLFSFSFFSNFHHVSLCNSLSRYRQYFLIFSSSPFLFTLFRGFISVFFFFTYCKHHGTRSDHANVAHRIADLRDQNAELIQIRQVPIRRNSEFPNLAIEFLRALKRIQLAEFVAMLAEETNVFEQARFDVWREKKKTEAKKKEGKNTMFEF